MSCASFLRRIGWLPPRQATHDDVVDAQTENASRDNESAFQEMHKVYTKVPELHQQISKAARRSNTPFVDLERLMHGALKKNGRDGNKSSNP